MKATTGSDIVYYTRGFELISRQDTSAASYYIYDGGLSVRALTNEAGTVTDSLVFDAFGNETTKTGTSDNSYGFQGEEKDSTGLYYLRARYMDPSTGTFTSMDTYGGSLSDPMSLHKYLFANSNPVMYSDPSGYNATFVETDTVVAIITIFATISTGIVYNILGDITGADKTRPSYWVGMFVAMIIAAILAYWVAGAFVAGVAIYGFGKLAIGILAMFTGRICGDISYAARRKGYDNYADMFEFAGILLGAYGFGETLEGLAESAQSVKEALSEKRQPDKRGYIRVGGWSKSDDVSEQDPNESISLNRKEAFNEAKERVNVPKSQSPDRQWQVGQDINKKGSAYGNYKYDPNPKASGRYYEYDTQKGKVVIAEHTKDGIPHFHAGEPKSAYTGNPHDYNFYNNRYKNINVPGKNPHIYYNP